MATKKTSRKPEEGLETIELPAEKAYYLQRLEVLRDAQGDLLSWAKNRLWFISAIALLGGGFGINYLIKSSVESGVQKRLAEHDEKFQRQWDSVESKVEQLAESTLTKNFTVDQAQEIAKRLDKDLKSFLATAVELERRTVDAGTRVDRIHKEQEEVRKRLENARKETEQVQRDLAEKVKETNQGYEEIDKRLGAALALLDKRIGTLQVAAEVSDSKVVADLLTQLSAAAASDRESAARQLGQLVSHREAIIPALIDRFRNNAEELAVGRAAVKSVVQLGGMKELLEPLEEPDELTPVQLQAIVDGTRSGGPWNEDEEKILRRLSGLHYLAQQWHLGPTVLDGVPVDAHANVKAAWEVSRGEGVTIAVIGDGVDLLHPEFASEGKIVFPRDVARRLHEGGHLDSGDYFGTAVAGVACADGAYGASGVAPRAKLMPIRLTFKLGSQEEADTFRWAAENGADVICCAWGPAGGSSALPASTKAAIEWAVKTGRNGKGCVIVWAAGNDSADIVNEGYASNPNVIAAGACNIDGKKADYSNFGDAIWCVFPSGGDFRDPGKYRGVWTTDRSGPLGMNRGGPNSGEDAAGNYTKDFQGTAVSAPGVAGVAALILSANPKLTWIEVKEVIKNSCDKIDRAGGNYDPKGHSKLYGYGRVNARRAVELAKEFKAN